MADHFYVVLRIGGEVTPEVRDKLVELIEAEGYENLYIPDEEKDQIEVEFAEVLYGDLPDLRQFLSEHEVSYHKFIEGAAGYDTVILWPIYEKTLEFGSCYANTDFTPLIEAGGIMSAMAEPGATLETVQQFIQGKLPPELPPFTVTSDIRADR